MSLAAAVVVACGLYTPCDLPPPVKHPAPHVTVTKQHVKPAAPKPVDVPPVKPIEPVAPSAAPVAVEPSIFTLPTSISNLTKFTPPTPPKPKGKTMLENVLSVYKWVVDLSWPALLLGAIVLYYTARHGWPWVQAKATSIWNSFKTDVSALEARVSVLEQVTRAAPVVAAPAPALVVAPIPAPAA